MTDTYRNYRMINRFVNSFFIIYLLITTAFCACSLNGVFQQYQAIGLKVLNIIAYSVYLLSCIILVLSFQFSFKEKQFPVKKFIWNLIRGILTYLIMFTVNSLDVIFKEGLYLSL